MIQVQEHVVAELIQGLDSFAAGDEDRLSEHFDGYLKEKIYRIVLQDEGGKEIRGFLDNIKLNKRYRTAVFSLLKRARLAAADIPSFAPVIYSFS